MIKLLSLIIIFIIIFYYNYNIFFESFNTKNLNTKIKVYNYYTTWCGWSQKFLPEWKKFSDKVSNSDTIDAIEIHCDDSNNESKCINIPGFPYVIIEKNNEIIPYEGERTAEKILEFVNKL